MARASRAALTVAIAIFLVACKSALAARFSFAVGITRCALVGKARGAPTGVTEGDDAPQAARCALGHSATLPPT